MSRSPSLAQLFLISHAAQQLAASAHTALREHECPENLAAAREFVLIWNDRLRRALGPYSGRPDTLIAGWHQEIERTFCDIYYCFWEKAIKFDLEFSALYGPNPQELQALLTSPTDPYGDPLQPFPSPEDLVESYADEVFAAYENENWINMLGWTGHALGYLVLRTRFPDVFPPISGIDDDTEKAFLSPDADIIPPGTGGTPEAAQSPPGTPDRRTDLDRTATSPTGPGPERRESVEPSVLRIVSPALIDSAHDEGVLSTWSAYMHQIADRLDRLRVTVDLLRDDPPRFSRIYFDMMACAVFRGLQEHMATPPINNGIVACHHVQLMCLAGVESIVADAPVWSVDGPNLTAPPELIEYIEALDTEYLEEIIYLIRRSLGSQPDDGLDSDLVKSASPASGNATWTTDPNQPASADSPRGSDSGVMPDQASLPRLARDDLACAVWLRLKRDGKTPSVADVAREIGCARTGLYRCPNLMSLIRADRLESRVRRSRLPRGCQDDRTGKTEAWMTNDAEN
jgi:hypothetical protein